MKKRALTFISVRDKKILYIVGVILLAVLVILLILGVIAYWPMQNNTDADLDSQEFAEISKDKDNIVSQLVSYLGDNVTSQERKNLCFNTEQGPYDNGRLWCQVATIVHLKQQINFTELGQKFVAFAKEQGLETHANMDSGVSTFSFDTKYGRWCELGYSDANGNSGSAGTYDVLSGVDGPTFAVACADRAKAKYYPYVD